MLREACEKFVETRAREGAHLKEDLLVKLDGLDEMVCKVETRSPEVVRAYREKLEQKVHDLLEDSQIDDNRIAAEVVLFLTRSAMMRRPSVCTAISLE